jgi:hypothetical protein
LRGPCGVLNVSWVASPALAAEGASLAGPIGGTDMRSALLPPPGLYGGLAGVASNATGLTDGSGNPAPGLDAVDLKIRVGGPFMLYVPDVDVFGGRLGVFGVVPVAKICGQIVSMVPVAASPD